MKVRCFNPQKINFLKKNKEVVNIRIMGAMFSSFDCCKITLVLTRTVPGFLSFRDPDLSRSKQSIEQWETMKLLRLISLTLLFVYGLAPGKKWRLSAGLDHSVANVAWILYSVFFNPFEVPKYMNLHLGELLDLLVLHHTKLSELNTNGQFRKKKYVKHRRSIEQIQTAIEAILHRSKSSVSKVTRTSVV